MYTRPPFVVWIYGTLVQHLRLDPYNKVHERTSLTGPKRVA